MNKGRKKSNVRRFLAGLLSVCLIVGMIWTYGPSMQAKADDPEPPAGMDSTDTVDGIVYNRVYISPKYVYQYTTSENSSATYDNSFWVTDNHIFEVNSASVDLKGNITVEGGGLLRVVDPTAISGTIEIKDGGCVEINATTEVKKNITVEPGGCLIISGSELRMIDDKVINLRYASDNAAQLQIFNNGQVIDPDTGTREVINADSNAVLALDNKTNSVPEGITLKNNDGSQGISLPLSNGWNEFIYQDNNEWWEKESGSSSSPVTDVEVNIDNTVSETWTLSYSYTGWDATDYTAITGPDPDHGVPNYEPYGNGNGHYIKFLAQTNKTIWIKLETTEKIVSRATLGETDPGVNNGQDLFDGVHDSNRWVGTANGKHYFIYKLDFATDPKTNFHFSLGYENEGDKNVVDVIKSQLFAYTGTSAADMQKGLAAELYARYFAEDAGGAFTGEFGITSPRSLYDPDHSSDTRITIGAQQITTAYKTGDTTIASYTLKYYPYTITLGKDANGNDVKVTGNVYQLNGASEVLVEITDSSGNKSFYVRDMYNDAVNFDGTDLTGSSTTSNQVGGTTDIAVCIATDHAGGVRIGGNGAGASYEDVGAAGGDVFSVSLSKHRFIEAYNATAANGGYGGSLSNFNTDHNDGKESTILRIISPTNTYVVVAAEGEPNKVPGIDAGQCDTICQTGAGKQTEVFIGDTTVHIHPIDGNLGVNTTAITRIALKGTYDDEAVSVTNKIENGKFVDGAVKFGSNFYDSVTVTIYYQNGPSQDLTINRIGLVVNYEFLTDPKDNNTYPYELPHGSQEHSGVNVNYNFRRDGQHVIAYATYYHPTNYDTHSGSNNIKLFVTYANGQVDILDGIYTQAGGGYVATTDFVIGFISYNSQDANGNYTIKEAGDRYMRPFSAIVVNGGYDAADSYGGTQVGAGRGVYWNGVISWKY